MKHTVLQEGYAGICQSTQGGEHQENDALSDLSDLSCTRHVRRNKTDLMDLTQAMYLSVQGTNSLHKAVQTL
jgi:hypothetical protein